MPSYQFVVWWASRIEAVILPRKNLDTLISVYKLYKLYNDIHGGCSLWVCISRVLSNLTRLLYGAANPGPGRAQLKSIADATGQDRWIQLPVLGYCLPSRQLIAPQEYPRCCRIGLTKPTDGCAETPAKVAVGVASRTGFCHTAYLEQ